MHKKEIAADLRSARRLSGLSNRDVATLLDVDAGRISRLETGTSEPSGQELALLALVYGKSLGFMLPCSHRRFIKGLRKQLSKLPGEPRVWSPRKERQATLNRLADDLEGLISPYHDVA